MEIFFNLSKWMSESSPMKIVHESTMDSDQPKYLDVAHIFVILGKLFTTIRECCILQFPKTQIINIANPSSRTLV